MESFAAFTYRMRQQQEGKSPELREHIRFWGIADLAQKIFAKHPNIDPEYAFLRASAFMIEHARIEADLPRLPPSPDPLPSHPSGDDFSGPYDAGA